MIAVWLLSAFIGGGFAAMLGLYLTYRNDRDWEGS